MQRADFKLLQSHLDDMAGKVVYGPREHARSRQGSALGSEEGLWRQGARRIFVGPVDNCT